MFLHHSSHGMLPEKWGDGFRRRGYSSHFYAEYPRNLVVSANIRNFSLREKILPLERTKKSELSFGSSLAYS